jgi:DNA-binding NarL/FixJ family response regulator
VSTVRINGEGWTSSARVLVVDDHEPVRRLVCLTLRETPELQVVGQASDGLEAVRKAQELQPDLILLDIGLPDQSGIEAARRIRKLAPNSKILFMSLDTSAEVVQVALNLGALAYISKSSAGTDLLPGVRAAIRGQEFVSASLRFSRDFASLPPQAAE